MQVSSLLNKGRNLSTVRSLTDPERTDWVLRETEVANYDPSIKFSELQAAAAAAAAAPAAAATTTTTTTTTIRAQWVWER